MEQLKEALAQFGWGNYEAGCYAALVRFGSMKASRVASETGIRKSKVYEPLNNLEEKGYVKITSENPKVYNAQNPRYVIEQEQRKFDTESQQVLEQLQEAWEIQEELEPQKDHAWVVSSRNGAEMELSKLVEEAEESIKGFDRMLIRAPREVVETLEERAEDGLEIELVGGSQSRRRLTRLERAGATVRELTEINRSSYYIADGERVLLNIGGGETTVVFEDQDIANIIKKDFQNTFKEASEVEEQ
jgi:sugar-specific transcriptional regulator TrmB